MEGEREREEAVGRASASAAVRISFPGTGTSQLLRERANYSETLLAETDQLLVGLFLFVFLSHKQVWDL